MCGIAGGLFFRGRVPPDRARAAVNDMVWAVAHRGPDGRGVYASCGDADAAAGRPLAILGHTRLAIIDVSDAGAQPMGGPGSRPWITFNGEIYNFAALRSELERAGRRFNSHSDTETILRGYEEWGPGIVERLRGMFAFAIWDEARQQLFIARDRLGIKPIYWCAGDGFVLFASEVRALLASGLVPRRLDTTALWQYLGYQSIPAPRTLIQDVSAMNPASWLTVSASGDIAAGTSWRMLDVAKAPIDVSREEARRLVGEKLRDAVKSHLVSDVPVGAFLSGGIDSSAVVALIRENGVQPRTFSVGFDERAFDETAHASLVARTFAADHTHVPLSGRELLAQLPQALDAMDQPTGDAVNTYVVSGAVRARGLKVALSGLGGDEVFGGYPSFARLMRIADVSRLWGSMPDGVRRLAGTAVRAMGGRSITAGKMAALVESDGEISSMFPLMRQVLSVDQRTALVSGSVLETIADRQDPYDRLLLESFADVPEASLFARISFGEARTYMHDVLLRDTDQMSMAHALEVRVPLLDHELVDLVTAIPDAHKQSSHTPKCLLVESLDGLLPDDIVHRPKQGFTLPFDPWMRGPLRGFCEQRLGEGGLVDRGIMQPDAVADLWRSFIEGRSHVSWSRLWVLVVLDAWLERNGVQR